MRRRVGLVAVAAVVEEAAGSEVATKVVVL